MIPGQSSTPRGTSATATILQIRSNSCLCALFLGKSEKRRSRVLDQLRKTRGGMQSRHHAAESPNVDPSWFSGRVIGLPGGSVAQARVTVRLRGLSFSFSLFVFLAFFLASGDAHGNDALALIPAARPRASCWSSALYNHLATCTHKSLTIHTLN